MDRNELLEEAYHLGRSAAQLRLQALDMRKKNLANTQVEERLIYAAPLGATVARDWLMIPQASFNHQMMVCS